MTLPGHKYPAQDIKAAIDCRGVHKKAVSIVLRPLITHGGGCVHAAIAEQATPDHSGGAVT